MLRSVSNFTRYTGELASWQTQPALSDEDVLASPYLYAVLFAVPAGHREEFDDWYTQDHVPLLLGCPDWLGCRR